MTIIARFGKDVHVERVTCPVTINDPAGNHDGTFVALEEPGGWITSYPDFDSGANNNNTQAIAMIISQISDDGVSTTNKVQGAFCTHVRARVRKAIGTAGATPMVLYITIWVRK